ncbi:unnamed protein product, partial [Rotaria sp. Silwood2]
MNVTPEHISNFFKPSTYATTKSNKDRKERLASDLTLMCCCDLLPFSIVSNEGFQDFLMAYNIVNTVDDIRSRATLNPFHLNQLYNAYMDRLNEELKEAPYFPGSNVQKAWRLVHVMHLSRAAHGLHNLLMVDVIPKIDGLSELLDKVQTIISKLRYRENELRDAFLSSSTDSNAAMIEDILTVSELLDADISSRTELDEEDDDNTSIAL